MHENVLSHNFIVYIWDAKFGGLPAVKHLTFIQYQAFFIITAIYYKTRTMKKIKLLIAGCLFTASVNAQFGGFLNNVANKVSDDESNKAANDIEKAMEAKKKKQQDSVKQVKAKQDSIQQSSSGNGNGSSTTGSSGASTSAGIDYKAYSNYDFVPGDTIIFADNFKEDMDGEFPSHWGLDAGQGVLNKVGNDEAFSLTQGNLALVYPRMKSPSYFGNAYTIEFDYFANNGYGVTLIFKDATSTQKYLEYNTQGAVASTNFSRDFNATYPGANFAPNTWHHAAFIYKNGEIKCYVDQYRVLIMPSVVEKFSSVEFGGIGTLENPIIFKNVRIASGGNMNMIPRKFTGSKIVTHGIHFDVGKATILPESMGTLNMIVNVLNNNPGLKFEIDGYTDNSGTAQSNVTLSQQRADAVKTQLVSMGIDASRLTTKGYGEANPVSTNDTQAGRANNRRVEFVKI